MDVHNLDDPLNNQFVDVELVFEFMVPLEIFATVDQLNSFVVWG